MIANQAVALPMSITSMCMKRAESACQQLFAKSFSDDYCRVKPSLARA